MYLEPNARVMLRALTMLRYAIAATDITLCKEHVESAMCILTTCMVRNAEDEYDMAREYDL